MKQWANLDARERRLLIIIGVLLGLLLLWAVIWQPLVNKSTRLADTVRKQQADLAWMRSAQEEIKRLRNGGNSDSTTASGQSLLGALDQSIRRDKLGPALKRLEPDAEGKGVRVWFEQASFDDVIYWLGEAQNSHNVRVDSITVDRAGSGGLVNVRLTLEGGQ